MHKRPYILTIAGLDPSGGAGILADIKTFESLKCYGLAVTTANTVQNDIDFKSCDWLSWEKIKDQLDILLDRFSIQIVKIGIVENWLTLEKIINHLHARNGDVKIILDPVLKSSSNYEFHSPEVEKLEGLLSKIYMLTPNSIELKKLYPNLIEDEACVKVSNFCHLYLKGGHRENNPGKDELFRVDGKHFALNPKMKGISEKHGSGCVLSSAISAYIALDFPLLKACFRAKRYTEKYLSSNPSLLGFHKL